MRRIRRGCIALTLEIIQLIGCFLGGRRQATSAHSLGFIEYEYRPLS